MAVIKALTALVGRLSEYMLKNGPEQGLRLLRLTIKYM